ncbi:MAG: HD domain-containing phosphohydrolase [Verrucomicrobiota bacterium]|jgi:response regulator RpfG family c-di-GMP phosphodiesterase
MYSPDEIPLPSDPILVVDDEKIFLSAVLKTLQRAGYPAVAHSSPLEALAELQRRKFSVIISDQLMPELSGLELLARARQIQPFATRILATAVLNLDTVIAAINKGEIFRFIIKPWLHEEFIATLKNAIQRHQLICQNARLQEATQTMNAQLVELNRSLEQQVQLTSRQNQELAQLNAALETNLFRSIELCVHTMQTFYPSLGNQARRVTELCRTIGQIAKLPPDEQRVLESAALLHDIGLVGVPRQIIRRWQEDPDLLTEPERALIQQHPILGQELAAFVSHFDKVGQTIRGHHERYDGHGYPDQLVAENIPWLARLLAVPVAFASCRLTDADAVERIKTGGSTAFDSEALKIFLRAQAVASVPRRERQVSLGDLRPGMVLSRGIYTPSGLLLVPEGQRLNATYIEKVLNYNRVQPLVQALTVYC